MRARCFGALAAVLLVGACAALPAGASAAPPHIKHFFVIVLENENAEYTYGADPPSPFLGKTLRSEGAFIPNYFGIGHQSLDNYIAMVSGQPPNLVTQGDCLLYTDFLALSIREDGVAIGAGCVYPQAVQTVANQLEDSGHSWRGYMQDMANSVIKGEPASCRHPSIGSYDGTQLAEEGDQYASRHDPFVYFHSIADFATCGRNVVDLGKLPEDLRSAATTPEYSFITPDLCADGHDATCVEPGAPGGFAGIDAFLREWVPRIESSPGFADDGALMVTFDESETGAESCCGEELGPNTLNNGGAMPGNGGGRVGAVLVSPCIAPGTVSQASYNHYSMLRWVEDDFGLSHLADASAPGVNPFGSDVFSNPACDTRLGSGTRPGSAGGGGRADEREGATTLLLAKPRHAVAGQRRIFRFHLKSDVAACERGAEVHVAGRTAHTNRRGRARLKLRPAHAGTLHAVARPADCPPASAAIQIKRP